MRIVVQKLAQISVHSPVQSPVQRPRVQSPCFAPTRSLMYSSVHYRQHALCMIAHMFYSTLHPSMYSSDHAFCMHITYVLWSPVYLVFFKVLPVITIGRTHILSLMVALYIMFSCSLCSLMYSLAIFNFSA